MNKKTRDYYSWLVTQGHYPKPPLPKGRGLRLRDKWVKRWLQKMGDYKLAQYYLKYKYGPAATNIYCQTTPLLSSLSPALDMVGRIFDKPVEVSRDG